MTALEDPPGGVYEFPAMTWEQMLAEADRQEDFVVPGLISARSTLLYGEAKVGKSFLAANLVHALTTGGEFLGRQVEVRPWRIALATTDDGAEAEYGDRIRTLTREGDPPPNVLMYRRLPAMRSPQMWADFHRKVVETDRCSFLIVDNLTQAIHGSFNEDNAVRQFFAGLRRFVDSGVPVVVVGHSSEKSGERGKPNLPMGSSAIRASIRWQCFVRRAKSGRLTLEFSGNHAEPHSLTVEHGVGARFNVVASKSAGEAQADTEAKAVQRRETTLDRNAAAARVVVAECQGMSQRKAAELLADRFKGAPGTWANRLAPNGSVGSMLDREGAAWRLQPPRLAA